MLNLVDPAWVDLPFMPDLSGHRSLFSVHSTFPPFGFLGRLLMGLFCNESSILGALCTKSLGNSSSLVHCAQNPWEIPAMRLNRPAEEGDGTGWGLISVTVTSLIPKQFRSVSVSVTSGDLYR